MKEIEIDILSDGSIRFLRADQDTNEFISKIISELAPSQIEEVQKFLNGAKQIQVLFGSESLCG